MQLVAEQATRLFDVVLFVASYYASAPLAAVATAIVDRLDADYCCSPFALCEHAINQVLYIYSAASQKTNIKYHHHRAAKQINSSIIGIGQPKDQYQYYWSASQPATRGPSF